MAGKNQDRLQAIYGVVAHSASQTEVKVLDSALIVVDSAGRIVALEADLPRADIAWKLAELNLDQCPVRELSREQFLIPGFVDTHNHAPQWMHRGLGQGMQILDWLSKIAFPNEARLKDTAYARKAYNAVVTGMLRQGVTTASYYGSLHGEATEILADICLDKGQRALVGKCNMNRNSPDYYRDASVDESLRVTRDCIAHIKSIDPEGKLVRPVLTPRFAISCEESLLAGLGELAAENPGMAIQTHFNESEQETSTTLSLFPGFANEADLYAHYGLLTPHSILAHCTLMTPYEMQRLQGLGCGIAHCPTANMTVGGGFMAAPVHEFLERGIDVGLGTDSGGGYSPSILNAMRHALVASFARDFIYAKNGDASLSLDQVFHMATIGGARVVGFGDEIGDFTIGKQFDALLVDMGTLRGGVATPLQPEDSSRTMFDKFIMTGDDRNIVAVFTQGREVFTS
ncbi:amidohydrolase family protein [Hirsutella rhossiliensis]|uniref:Probable guanine deaminase n=1 Tax=Hirsutella rhossiliensis TaxID=111463 RepID=A0A9P8SPL7_9HYPO|nr:amidohydrolase family domain-containing protein [Hirsutella rhossiliensis]KAH0968346.1 amidohydrolase family domain-containing protein [Hirsutella rhossiliensis]